MNSAFTFYAAAGLLVAFVLWILLRPLLAKRADGAAQGAGSAGGQTNVDALRVELSEARRDHKLGLLSDASLAEAERELEGRVLAEASTEASPATPRYRGTALGLGVLLPMFAVAGYSVVGSPTAVVKAVAQPARATPSVADNQMDELFKMAEERLKKEPDDAKGWALLARAKASVGMFDGAMQAYEKAVALDAKNSDLWSDYADAAAGMSQGKMDGKPMELVGKSLALDGKNPKALLLRGTWEIQKNDLTAAEQSFKLARTQVEAGSGFAQIAENALSDIQSRRGGAMAPSAAAPAAAGAGTASTPRGETSAVAEAATGSDVVLATINVSLGSDARKTTSPTAAIFLIVRAAGVERGPPLAAKKIAVSDLEQPVLLTAADGMIGSAGLKPGADVVLQARLSKTGQPIAQPGDWQSTKMTAKLPVAKIALMIDQAVPN